MATSSSHSTPPPYGKYASWAATASIVTGILAIIGSLSAGRGHVGGTVIALILNPIAWLAIWFWFKSNKISCPHCGSGVAVTPHLATQKTGSIVPCTNCRNEFRKPPMDGQSVSDAEPVRSQPVANRPTQPINRGEWSQNAEVLRPSVHVVEPKTPEVAEPARATCDPASMLPVIARPVAQATEQYPIITVETSEPQVDLVIMRVDGTNSFVTLKEHQRRDWKHAARCDLSNMNFRGISFAGANLEGAKLDSSDFTGCDFRNAILNNASAKHCNFEGANFAGAQLKNSVLQESNLKKAKFCTVSGAFESAVIEEVDFERCNLSDAVFVRTLPNTSQPEERCTVKHSVFSGSDLSSCNLQGMDFRTCKLKDANLFGTSLQRCNFEGVDLSSANLINAQLSQIVYSESSKFPDGFVLPGNAKNADVVRKTEEVANRKNDRMLLFGLAIFVFVIIVGSVIASLSSGSRTATPSDGAEENETSILERHQKSVPDVKSDNPPQIRNSIGMDLKLIPAGDFSKEFYIGVYEVTQRQFEIVMGRNPSHYKVANNPVEMVSWYDAVVFCEKLSKLKTEKSAGRVYRLPTEVEWEFACRAGTTTAYSFGDVELGATKYGWFVDNSGGTTHAVGEKLANPWGLYDMHGNVWEWCSDKQSSTRVVRGGSWDIGVRFCRSDSRGVSDPKVQYEFGGFRVALNSPSVDSPDVEKRAEPDPSSVVVQLATIENSIGMSLKLIPAGTFTMGSKTGSPREQPAHQVTVSKDFYIGLYEVTQQQFERVMGSNPSRYKGPDNPVETVSWYDAVVFCEKLSTLQAEKAADRVYRLPTEAEWEYACRAGTTTAYSFGDAESSLGEYAWFKENRDSATHAVGTKLPNSWGLYDMHGNVAEWCENKGERSFRVYRGSASNFEAAFCRSAYRNTCEPSVTSSSLGFRVVLSPPIQ